MDKYSIEAIRVNNGKTREEMAELLGITLGRYHRIVSNRSKILATELIKIHEIFDIPYEQISIPMD